MTKLLLSFTADKRTDKEGRKEFTLSWTQGDRKRGQYFFCNPMNLIHQLQRDRHSVVVANGAMIANADLTIWHDGTEFVIATSAEDAAEILRDLGGDGDVGAFDRWEPSRLFTFDPCDGTERITKTAAEWAAERGRGWLATTEF